jgi:signal transduction histidine kinase
MVVELKNTLRVGNPRRRGGAPRGLTAVLESAARSAVLAERARLARELHDTVVQEFSGILLHLQAAMDLPGAGQPELAKVLALVQDTAQSGLEDARRVLLGLRPAALENNSLNDALDGLARRFSAGCRIPCQFRASGHEYDVPPRVKNELYRIAQEALCNVRKHSAASLAFLWLNYESFNVTLTIKDDGRGLGRRGNTLEAGGFGMAGMRERAFSIGGTFELNRVSRAGTELRVTVPVGHSGNKSHETKPEFAGIN